MSVVHKFNYCISKTFLKQLNSAQTGGALINFDRRWQTSLFLEASLRALQPLFFSRPWDVLTQLKGLYPFLWGKGTVLNQLSGCSSMLEFLQLILAFFSYQFIKMNIQIRFWNKYKCKKLHYPIPFWSLLQISCLNIW